MPTNINCKFYSAKCARCLHGDAPRGLFSQAQCLLVITDNDPRVPRGCVLQVKYDRQDIKNSRSDNARDNRRSEAESELSAGLYNINK